MITPHVNDIDIGLFVWILEKRFNDYSVSLFCFCYCCR